MIVDNVQGEEAWVRLTWGQHEMGSSGLTQIDARGVTCVVLGGEAGDSSISPLHAVLEHKRPRTIPLHAVGVSIESKLEDPPRHVVPHNGRRDGGFLEICSTECTGESE